MREYVRPMALVEEFVANKYVAACNYSLNNNDMRCINPAHTDDYGEVFGNVWVSELDECTVKVSDDSIRTEIRGADRFRPEQGAWVYRLGGNPAQIGGWRSTWNGHDWYAAEENGKWVDDCYGSYTDNGNIAGNIWS